MRFLLDQCVPDSVGKVLETAGHEVIYLREAIAPDTPDPIVALVSAENEAVLVSFDSDFKGIASRAHVSNKRLRKLSRISCKCGYPQAAKRIEAAIGFIETEWEISQNARDKRMFIEIQKNAMKTLR